MSRMSRVLASGVAVAALTGGGVLAIGATATAGSLSKHRRVQQGPPLAYAGYADAYRKGQPSAPSPWKGTSGVIFEGCNYFSPDRCPKSSKGGDRYDSGAIQIVNPTVSESRAVTTSMTVTKVYVTIGTCTFRPWPKLNVTVPAGGELILTQTGGKPPCNTTGGKYNFDSSETSHSCTNDQLFPQVHMTVDGVAWTEFDTHQVLNTGGMDIGNKMCGHHNETTAWSQLAIPGVAANHH